MEDILFCIIQITNEEYYMKYIGKKIPSQFKNTI